jgi:hypothetical protein
MRGGRGIIIFTGAMPNGFGQTNEEETSMHE